MKDRTRDELRALDDSALKRYFDAKARYSDQMPKAAQYFIRLSGRTFAICSDDTLQLWKDFKKAVRKGK